MKKTVTLLLLLAMTLSMTACAGKQESSSQTESSLTTAQTENCTAEPRQTQPLSPTKLTNKMTESELLNVQKHSLTILDKPKEPQESTTEQEKTDHTVEVEFQSTDSEAIRRNIEKKP